jgi:hypothetical protein
MQFLLTAHCTCQTESFTVVSRLKQIQGSGHFKSTSHSWSQGVSCNKAEYVHCTANCAPKGKCSLPSALIWHTNNCTDKCATCFGCSYIRYRIIVQKCVIKSLGVKFHFSPTLRMVVRYQIIVKIRYNRACLCYFFGRVEFIHTQLDRRGCV